MASNLAVGVVHHILEDAIDIPEIASRYRKETLNAFAVAKKYRGQINPPTMPLAASDIATLREKTSRKVRAELARRIAKGYTGIDLERIAADVDAALQELKIS
jgi:hypothetical protein